MQGGHSDAPVLSDAKGAYALTLDGTVLRVLAGAGLVGCVLLVLSLPLAGVLWTVAVVLVGVVAGRLTLPRPAA